MMMKLRLIRTLRLPRPAWWMVAVALATAWVWQRYAVVRLGEDVEQAQRRIVALNRVRSELLADNSALASQERIRVIAANRLGLRPTMPTQRRVLLVDAARADTTGRMLAAGD